MGTPTAEQELHERVERLEHLLAMIGGGSSASEFTSFIWRPGGIAGGNVYTTWASLVAAVAAVSGPRFIGVDTDLGAAIIPAGNWDLSPAGISGPVTMMPASKLTFATLVSIANAAVTINGWTGIRDLIVNNASTVDVMTGTRTFDIALGGLVNQTFGAAGAAFIKAGNGTIVTIFLRDFSRLDSLGGIGTLQQTGTGQMGIFVGDGCIITDNMLVGALGNLFVRLEGSNTIYGQQAGAPAVIPIGGRQTGVAQILNAGPGAGKTAAITIDGNGQPVCISSAVRFLVTIHDPTNDAATVKYGVLTADISAPSPTGSFKISALTALGNGDVNVNDTTTLYWEVINQGP